MVVSPLKPLSAQSPLREVLLWCLPALLVGLVLRVILTWQLPYAYFHSDAADFLTTVDDLLLKGHWEIHGKKTWLLPTLFAVPVILGGPALVIIPVIQHAAGLVLVIVIGALVRLWFDLWRWAIIPLTLLTAANPFMLWYEHTLMAETAFILFFALVGLAGTLYARKQSPGRFGLLAAALFFAAGARPEGKLLLGFAVLFMAAVHGRDWRTRWAPLAAMLFLAAVTHYMTRSTHAGLLLYTSLARLTPTELRVAPGFPPRIAPLQEDLQRRWLEAPSFPKTAERRVVFNAVAQYLRDQGKRAKAQDVETFAFKIAAETARRQWRHLPEIAWHKFRHVATEAPSGNFNKRYLFTKQGEAMRSADELMARLSPALAGVSLATGEDFDRFIASQYRELAWYDTLWDRWLAAVNTVQFPESVYQTREGEFRYPGVPLLYFVAALGLFSTMLRRGVLRPFHVCWGLTLVGMLFVIMVTGNVRARFRFAFEPFWFIYAALLLENCWRLLSPHKPVPGAQRDVAAKPRPVTAAA